MKNKLYHVFNKDHSISEVVRASGYRAAAKIVSEFIAESNPPGTGGRCCVQMLIEPEGNEGMCVAFVGNEDWFDIRPNKVIGLAWWRMRPRAEVAKTVRVKSQHIREEWDEGEDGYWISLKKGWKWAGDSLGNVHCIHEPTRKLAHKEDVMPCDCSDCKSKTSQPTSKRNR